MISIGGSEREVQRARFKTFLAIQHYQEQVHTTDDPTVRADLICECVGLVLEIPKDIVSSETWKNVAMAYAAIATANILTIKLPFMKAQDNSDEKVPWDYPGRDWPTFAHMFAKHYGWSLEYIANLEVEDALKLLQEIMVAEQLQREWEWDLSEKSTAYDPSTKKSRHIELPRPSWMVVVPEPPKKIKIHRDLMPQGLVIGLDGKRVEFG